VTVFVGVGVKVWHCISSAQIALNTGLHPRLHWPNPG
jgi:hypothetical protein